MVTYVTIETVHYIHEEQLSKFGGLPGVRDIGLLESALARPAAGFGDYETYTDIFMKAAVLCHSLIKNHPFRDANKRTGIVTTIFFLESNGHTFKAATGEIVDFALKVATDKVDETQMAVWLNAHSEPNQL